MIILAADEQGVLVEVLLIAAALEVQDPRDRPPQKQQAADQAHAVFADSRSDFLSYLEAVAILPMRRPQSQQTDSRAEKAVSSPTRMREWAGCLSTTSRVGK